MNKKWYRSPGFIIPIIVIAVGYFSWITKVAVLSETKAESTAVGIAQKQIETICVDIAKLQEAIKTHEKAQTEQIEKIYGLLIQMSKENKMGFRENKDNRK